MNPLPQTQNSTIILVTKAAEGDRQAFEQLFLLHRNLIALKVRKMTNCREDVEDIIQEVAIRVFQNVSSLRRPESFGSWLAAIVRAECIRYFGQKMQSTSFEDLVGREDFENLLIETDSDCLPAVHIEQVEVQNEIRVAIKSLPISFQSIFFFHYMEGRGYREIASSMDMPIGTVASYVSRARNRLGKELSVNSCGRGYGAN